MKKLINTFTVLIFGLCFSICLIAQEQKSISTINQPLILEDVTIIDGTGSLPQPSLNIFIEDGKITSISKRGERKYPKNAKVINLKNKFIIPGLIEMHTHLYNEEVCRTMLAYGITTMRIAAASPRESVEMRNRVASGEVFGPRIFTAGDLLDGTGSTSGGILVNSEEEIREVVRKQIATGVDYIKLYTSLTPELVKAAIDETHLHRLRVIGHLGKTSWTFAANSGIDALCHSAMSGPIWELIPIEKRDRFYNLSCPINGFNPDLFKEWGEAFNIDGPEMTELTKALVNNKVTVDPTLVMMEAMIWGNDSTYLDIMEPDSFSKNFTEKWRNGKLHPYTSWWSDEAHSNAKLLFPIYQKIIKRLWDKGVLLTSGTDLGNPWLSPGVSLYRELELLVNAGIPVLEVIKIATRNGAEALKILDEVGTIEIGKQADLVILNSNPVEGIKNIRNLEFVIKKGDIFYPANLLSK